MFQAEAGTGMARKKAYRKVEVYRNSCPSCYHRWLLAIPKGAPTWNWKRKCPNCKSPKIKREAKPLDFKGGVLIIWDEREYVERAKV